MLSFFSSSPSNTGNFSSSNGPPQIQGPSLMAGRSGTHGVFGGPDNRQSRGKSSGVQSGSAGNVLWPEVELTDEPLPAIDASGGIGRGRRAAASAAPPTRNQAQALALRSALETTENPKPESSLQRAPVAKVEEVGAPEIYQDSSNKEAKRKSVRIFPRRCFLGKSSIATSNDRSFRYPLRTGTDPPSTPYSNIHEVRPRPPRMSTIHENQVGLSRSSKSPFKSTLYSGSHDFSLTPPTLPAASIASTLHILAVGVAYNGLQDPQHDLDILRTLFGRNESENTRFKGISGDEVTLEIIEEAIGQLYKQILKSSGSNLLILLTGEGDGDNRMHLTKDKFITDKDLRRWMWKFQIDCHPNNRTVTIILDYCRENPGIPLGKSHVGVEFIWSCSPGQTAAALSFPSTQGIPRSCFLLALMMLSHNLSRNKGDLVAAVDREVHQLLRFLELIHNKFCDSCTKNHPCAKPHRPQDPDWQQAGSMKPIYDFVDRLSKMDIALKVHDLFIRHRYFREANGLPAEDATFEPTSSHQTGTTQHNRGSSKPVHAAPNIQIDSRKLPEDGGFFKDREQLLLK